LDGANIFVNDERYILTNLNTMAWVLIILGVIQLAGGFSPMAGNTSGRVIGMIGAIGPLLSVGGAYPWCRWRSSSCACTSSTGSTSRAGTTALRRPDRKAMAGCAAIGNPDAGTRASTSTTSSLASARETVAPSHAPTGDSVAIAAYLGKSDVSGPASRNSVRPMPIRTNATTRRCARPSTAAGTGI
jgi:hypothetical protein